MPYTAMQMFEIVNSADRYPEFLPWCSNAKILLQTETAMEATITMRKGKLNHSFTTRNRMEPGKSIHIDLVDGPFKQLTGDWSFISLGEDNCKIELDLRFEFSNAIIGMLIGPVFTQIANTLVDAFCQRAHQLYKS